MTRLMKSVVKDISDDLASRLRVEKPSDANQLLRLFSKLIAKEMTRQLLKEARRDPEGVRAIFANTTDPGKVVKGFEKAEGKLTKIIEKGLRNRGNEVEDADEDEVQGTGSQFPNLKYAQPKYQNVESILKFVEAKDDKDGGVKLIIMNFND